MIVLHISEQYYQVLKVSLLAIIRFVLSVFHLVVVFTFSFMPKWLSERGMRGREDKQVRLAELTRQLFLN